MLVLSTCICVHMQLSLFTQLEVRVLHAHSFACAEPTRNELTQIGAEGIVQPADCARIKK